MSARSRRARSKKTALALLTYGVFPCALLCPPFASTASAASCSFSASPVIFGGYDNTLNEMAVATISGTCSKGDPADPDMSGSTLTLSTGSSNAFNTRQMVKGSDRLEYNLYTSAARTIVWGDGTAGTGTVAALTIQSNGRFLNHNSSRNFAIPAYGRIPGSQDAVPGVYSDTITVTMSF
jgi:spore coat protein U-like protein